MSGAQINWDYPQPFSLTMRVAADDIDGLQHTNNTVYVKWCEQVAWAHSVSLGLDLDAYRRLDRAMAITRSEFHYLQASREGDELVAGTWIVNWDQRLTMQRRFQLVRVSDGVTLLRGGMLFACIEISSGRPRRLPPKFVAGYSGAVLGLGDDELVR
ncbi:acyl-CoA thioesterase [Seongchinamella sediminis]|uniref:Acyl-CoA thioesterase n=1 Tax=Seongchinamella sediminis TaxID=2283635 RepID=A0A3L7E205_9GAMM|nr:thioesterase family protein [Seongchinamella sediminis]RLQ23514.1 acyl-CoA thioesterase [Seongchinamella sediminis]